MNPAFSSALIGFFAGVSVAAFAQGRLDRQAIERGWMDHRGAIYLVTPAKPVAADPSQSPRHGQQLLQIN